MLAISMQLHRSFTILLLVFLAGLNHGVEGMASPNDLEIERYLKKMNKPANKTIKSPTGELIDCVDIYMQPSLDHPLLQNHTIQMDFNFNTTNINDHEPSNEIHQAWHINGKCPEGTVPIQRIQKGDILRASSLENFGKKSYPYFLPLLQADQPANSPNGIGHQYAGVVTRGMPFFGATADINLWNPKVQVYDFSNTQMWLSSSDAVNSLEAGLMVNPVLSDYETRLFIYWTSDSYKNTGCYNLLCQGFVQISKEIAPGSAMKPYSIYGGQQYQVGIKILQDTKSGNWWLTVLGKPVGYWPGTLLTHMLRGANLVQWGGNVFINPSYPGTSFTQMGSGHFPGEGFGKAALFGNAYPLDANGNSRSSKIEAVATKPQCYDVKRVGANSFFYGGPGNCAA